jgi:hypothetical protein
MRSPNHEQLDDLEDDKWWKRLLTWWDNLSHNRQKDDCPRSYRRGHIGVLGTPPTPGGVRPVLPCPPLLGESGRICLPALQHTDEHRSERLVLLAVDQQLAGLRAQARMRRRELVSPMAGVYIPQRNESGRLDHPRSGSSGSQGPEAA